MFSKFIIMNPQQPFRFSTGVIGYPIAFVLVIWIIYWIELRFGFRFNSFGVYPRTVTGLEVFFLALLFMEV